MACGDLHTAQRALLRVAGDFTSVDDADIEHCVKRIRTLQEGRFLGRLKEYLAIRPLIHKRIEALEALSRSEAYHAASGRSIPPEVVPLTRDELDAQVN